MDVIHRTVGGHWRIRGDLNISGIQDGYIGSTV